MTTINSTSLVSPFVCIKPLHGRHVKYLLIMTHFIDDDIPLACMEPVERGTPYEGVTIFSGHPPNGTHFPRFMRKLTLCTLTHRALIDPNEAS
jgi:hypothetical protein